MVPEKSKEKILAIKIPTSQSLDYWSNFWGSVHNLSPFFRDIGQNVLMANPNQQMFYSPYGDHSIQ